MVDQANKTDDSDVKESDAKKKKKLTTEEKLRSYSYTIFLAIIFAILFRNVFMEAYKIPTDYMSPTIISGDHIFVSKLTTRRFGVIGPKVPPQRGDVVIFAFPNDKSKDFIKRVVGVEGDKVEMKEGIVYVNSQAITKADPIDLPNLGSNKEILIDEEIDGRKYKVKWLGDSTQARKVTQGTVPKGQIFFLGDHRSRGQDSRNWGFVSASYVKGSASFIWFSKTKNGIQWSRIFKAID